jgi:hypothetical protein
VFERRRLLTQYRGGAPIAVMRQRQFRIIADERCVLRVSGLELRVPHQRVGQRHTRGDVARIDRQRAPQ